MKSRAFVLLLLLLPLSAQAIVTSVDVDDLHVDVPSPEIGIADSGTAFAQTPDGYLWVGTQRGLARYDGINVKKFDHVTNPELLRRYVQGLATDSQGHVIVAVNHAGIFRLVKERFVRLIASDQIPTGEMYPLHVSRNDTIWVPTLGGLVRRTADGRVSVLEHATSVAEDSGGRTWVATAHGIAIVSGDRFLPVAISRDIDRENVQMVAFARDGSMYVATHDALYRFAGGQRQKIATAQVFGVTEDRDGGIWIATAAGAGRYVAGAAAVKMVRAVGRSRIFRIFEARDGSIWIASSDGTFQLRHTLFTTYNKRNGFPADNVVSVATDAAGTLYIGSDEGGIYRLHGREAATLRPPSHPPDVRYIVWSLTVERNGSVWADLDEARFFLHDGKSTVDRATIVETVAHAGGRTWLVGRDRILDADRAGRTIGEVRLPELAGKHFYRAASSGAGGAWLSTAEGELYQLAPDARRATRWYAGEAVPYCVIEDGEVLWVGTLGGGLVRIAGGRKVHYRQSDGLLDDDIFGIVDDGYGFLWMSTGAGKIMRIAKSELSSFAAGDIHRLQPRVFGLADGFPSAVCNGGSPAAVRNRQGIWFATSEGLVKVDPNPELLKPQAQPQAIVESVEGDWSGPRRLRARRRPVTFRFTAPSFRRGESVRFQYRMEGLDSSWIDAGSNRSATYSNVPYGRYTFRVFATTSGSPADPSVAAGFAFSKERAVFEQQWFRALCTGAVLAVLAALYSVRVAALRRRQNALEEIVRNRTLMLAQANDALKRMSLADPLTGIPNRRCFDEHLTSEWQRANRARKPLALLFVDVDFFKKYNDAYGHQAGDRCLISVARAIDECAKRPGDLAARFGGEEFAVILPGTDEGGASVVAETIRARVEALALPHTASTVSPHVTLSIGVASVIPSAGSTPDTLIQLADGGVYRAKDLGRNRIHTGQPRLVPATSAAA